MNWENCLICFKHLEPPPHDYEETVTVEATKLTVVETGEVSGGNGNSLEEALNANLKVIFLLKNLFEVPNEKLEYYLENFGNPASWTRLCTKCQNLVEEARDIWVNLLKAVKQFVEIRSTVIGEIEKSTGLNEISQRGSVNSTICEDVRTIVNCGDYCKFSISYPFHSEKSVGDEEIPLISPKQEVIIADFDENGVALDPLSIDNWVDGAEDNWRPTGDEDNEEDDYYLDPEENVDESCDSDDYTPSSQRSSQSKGKRGRPKKESKLTCKFCGKGFPNEHGLSVHIGRSHGKDGKKEVKEIKEEQYVCEVEGCGKEFTWKQSFAQHMAKHRNGRKFKCDICGKGFFRKSALQYHLEAHKRKTINEKFVPVPERDETSKKILCSVDGCGKEFSWGQSYKSHMKRHNSQPNYECDQCGRKFFKKSNLSYHLEAHKRNTIPGTSEGQDRPKRPGRPLKALKSENEDDSLGDPDPSTQVLEEEIIPRENPDDKLEEKSSCKLCGIVFNSQNSLFIHMGRRHKGEGKNVENFVCSVEGCGKVYQSYQRQHYRLHMARHRKETRFRCLICGKEQSNVESGNQEENNDYVDDHEDFLDTLSPDSSDDDEWYNEYGNEAEEKRGNQDDDEWNPSDDEANEKTDEEELNNEEDENGSSDDGDSDEYTPKRKQRSFEKGSGENLSLKCTFCGKGYPNEHGLSVHIGRSHGKETRKEQYVCKVEGCGKVYGWKCTFKNHMLKHASESNSSLNERDTDTENKLKKTEEVDNEEDESSSESDDYTPSKIKGKKQRKFKDLPFKCKFCKMSFPNEHGLSVHTGRSHGKQTRKEKYVCEVEGCGNVYSWKHNFRDHMLKHQLNHNFRKKHINITRNSEEDDQEDQGSGGDDLAFSCSFCGKGYPNEHGLSVHIGRTHGKQTRKERYICEVEGCGNVYAHKSSYRNHMALHASNSISFEKFVDVSKLKKNEDTQKILCSVEGCGMEFARIQSYKIHMRRHEKVRKLTCHICGKMFYHQSSLLYHLGAHERNTVPTTLNENPKGRGRGRPVENFRPKDLNDPSTLILNEEIIPREKKKEIFKCRFCEKVFKNNRALTVHRGLLHKDLVNTRENFVCSVQGCGKVYEYYQRQCYRLHMARHRKETRFKCLLCGKEFYQQYTFLYHKQAHKRKSIGIPPKSETESSTDNLNNTLAEESPIFKCKFCGFEFPNKGQLTGHLRSHLGFKPKRDGSTTSALMHICDICGKSFKKIQYLRKHKQFIHEKKWVAFCDICGKGMGARLHLRLHMRVTHKIYEEGVQQYKCPVEGCRQRFYEEMRYKKHMQELHPSGGEGDPMPFNCEHCGRGFWRLNRWKEHLLTHKFVQGKRSRNKIVVE